MGKSTISMAIFNSYVKLPEGNGKVKPRNPIVGFFGRPQQTTKETQGSLSHTV